MKWLKKILGGSAITATHSITDDSGFLVIIDPDAYQGFVQKDWTLEMLRVRFKREMAERRLLIWGTGVGNTWRVSVSLQPSKASGFREIIGSIASSRGRLLLTNYESLTMAAQFDDIVLPETHEQNQVLQVSPGIYDCRIIQFSDPDSSAPFKESVSFVYELTLASEPRQPWRQIPWTKAFQD